MNLLKKILAVTAIASIVVSCEKDNNDTTKAVQNPEEQAVVTVPEELVVITATEEETVVTAPEEQEVLAERSAKQFWASGLKRGVVPTSGLRSSFVKYWFRVSKNIPLGNNNFETHLQIKTEQAKGSRFVSRNPRSPNAIGRVLWDYRFQSMNIDNVTVNGGKVNRGGKYIKIPSRSRWFKLRFRVVTHYKDAVSGKSRWSARYHTINVSP